jgi:hypothetical protein
VQINGIYISGQYRWFSENSVWLVQERKLKKQNAVLLMHGRLIIVS